MAEQDCALKIVDIVKHFRYINPDSNSNTADMWFAYLVGFIRRKERGMYSPKFEKIVALDGISFEIKQGEFFGLLGPNGSGKSTLIKIASGILSPDSGSVMVDGYDIVRETAQARASMTTIPSANWLIYDFAISLQANLEVWAALYGYSRKEAAERAIRALEIVGLQDRVNDHPGVLSSGMRQRFAIARGLMVATPIFLLDEPTANIDPNSAKQIRDFIRLQLNRQLGQTVLMATHDMAEAEALCDRVAIIDKGKLLACGTISELKSMLPGQMVKFFVRGATEAGVGALKESAAVLDVDVTFGPTGIDIITAHIIHGSEQSCAAELCQAGCDVAETAPAEFSLSNVFRYLTRGCK